MVDKLPPTATRFKVFVDSLFLAVRLWRDVLTGFPLKLWSSDVFALHARVS